MRFRNVESHSKKSPGVSDKRANCRLHFTMNFGRGVVESLNLWIHICLHSKVFSADKSGRSCGNDKDNRMYFLWYLPKTQTNGQGK